MKPTLKLSSSALMKIVKVILSSKSDIHRINCINWLQSISKIYDINIDLYRLSEILFKIHS